MIQSYLNGKSKDQISKEMGISTGKVSNIIKAWKSGIEIPNIEELMEFAITVKKFDMSIEQCAEGYRTCTITEKSRNCR